MNHDQNRHKLILLRGNSGSGKTTLARMLQHKLGRGTLVISQDVIRRDMLWAKDTKDGPCGAAADGAGAVWAAAL